MDSINFISIITIAFLGSFGHCIGMCGGIVVAYSSTKIDQKWSKTKQSIAHLLYSFGRIFTYVLLGAMFGFLGGVATFNNLTNGLLLIFAGTFMILAGLSLSGKIKFLTLFEHSFANNSWYSKAFREILQAKNSLWSFFVLGMLNGLLPCGLVYFFAITAASTASAFYGALVMLVFGLSTIPALFSLGFFVGLYKNGKLRNIMIRLAAVAVILFGFYTLRDGYYYIKYPQKTIYQCCEFDPDKIDKEKK
ncbi:Heavy-metal-associated domain (N-terminus) and membrane-bounded cytochrome biogenesis cycZ-like domain, possible membrane copper tolerance protein [hydrothermal vent metagenome]|uniref:Heavy-metal-associated domain (N-terminus) and membrane-bounded cytochrome biogenesis cycZ-like domain, possible membrane copper tolerance protein n=1 Tax=hydrothermal vent metagenome TaxID=652676 RepID=A0A1W1D5B9_9ZZZZ